MNSSYAMHHPSQPTYEIGALHNTHFESSTYLTAYAVNPIETLEYPPVTRFGRIPSLNDSSSLILNSPFPQLLYEPTGVFFDDKNLEIVEDALLRNDFYKIIKNSHLFFLAYCKAFYPHQQLIITRDYFEIKIGRTSLSHSGSSRDAICKTVEKIRIFFQNNLIEEKIEISLSHNQSIFLCDKNKKKSHIGVFFDEDSVPIEPLIFHSFILPALPQLAIYCGATFSKSTTMQLSAYIEKKEPNNLDVLIFTWNNPKKPIYPIPPKIIEPKEYFEKNLYPLFLKNKLCDFKLRSKEGSILSVHSIVLAASCGDVIQNIMTNLREGSTKQIFFSEYSQSAVRALADFSYLGPQIFSDHYLSSDDSLDLFEVYALAHAYMIKDLIDCTSNLINLRATPNHQEALQNLIDLYDDEYLNKVYKNLLETLDLDIYS